MTSIKCHSENIPETEIDAFDQCPSDMTIYVPEQSVGAYKTATPWNNYDIIGFSPTFIPEIHNNDFNIHPNPVNEKLYIKTEVEIEEVAVYDVYGRLQDYKTIGQQVIDVSNLNSGVYFVVIKTEKGNIVKRFIKQ